MIIRRAFRRRDVMKRIVASALFATLLLPIFINSQTPLKDVFKAHFRVGAALNATQFSGRDKRGERIVVENFNTISPENVLKWEAVQPVEGRFDFSKTDEYVAFGEKHKMFTVGHTLVWHNQTPKWVFEGPDGKPASRQLLTDRLRGHIFAVVGRYKGKIGAWDVVNEALNDDGTLRDSPWFRILGKEYISLAFKFAREADPAADLYYNDYSLEIAEKRRGMIELVRWLLSEKAPISGVGTQSHHKMDWPTAEEQERTLTDLATLGLKIAVTELDIDVLPNPSDYRGAEVTANFKLQARLDPFKKGFPAEQQAALAKRYADIFRVFVKHSQQIDRITFWCVTDADSWLNDWPVRGRTNHPLLWDRSGKPKPAFQAVVDTAGRN